MIDYKVHILEEHVIRIKADNIEEAEKIAEQRFLNDESLIYSNDYWIEKVEVDE